VYFPSGFMIETASLLLFDRLTANRTDRTITAMSRTMLTPIRNFMTDRICVTVSFFFVFPAIMYKTAGAALSVSSLFSTKIL